MTEYRNVLRQPCGKCNKPLGSWLLFHVDGKPLCDRCEIEYRANLRNEDVSLAAYDQAQEDIFAQRNGY